MKTLMRAMVLESPGTELVLKKIPIPEPSGSQLLLKVHFCGICRTDLHIIDGELKSPKLPLIPGHEVIATVVKVGDGVRHFKEGDSVGVPWLAYTCGKCNNCLSGRENLCINSLFTGYTIDGGFAEYMLAFESYCFNISSVYANSSGAPLMCAGLIGYRSYNMIGEKPLTIGIYGFGAAAHIMVQVALFEGKRAFVFTREGDVAAQRLALKLGAEWAGDSAMEPPQKLDAAIIFAPVGNLVPKALRDINNGGIVVCGGIHMSDIPSFPYNILWGEKTIKSVANLTRYDGMKFLELAPKVPIKTVVTEFKLENANLAIEKLRNGAITGAAVLTM